ncbi:MAG: hypothetical protein HY028_06140, partial [Gammaproteobacteria bacterium]|nr:hypothetical protein [Gammaproteobacteria bacterium]
MLRLLQRLRFTLTLSSDITGALTAGTPLSLSLSRIGQNGRLTFSGTAGSNVGIEVAGLSTVPAGKPIALTVYKPDGTTLSSTTASSPGGGFLNL